MRSVIHPHIKDKPGTAGGAGILDLGKTRLQGVNHLLPIDGADTRELTMPLRFSCQTHCLCIMRVTCRPVVAFAARIPGGCMFLLHIRLRVIRLAMDAMVRASGLARHKNRSGTAGALEVDNTNVRLRSSAMQ